MCLACSGLRRLLPFLRDLSRWFRWLCEESVDGVLAELTDFLSDSGAGFDEIKGAANGESATRDGGFQF